MPLGSAAQPEVPAQPTAAQAAQLAAATELQAAQVQQRAAQQREQQAQQLLDAQLREKQSMLEHQNQQLHQQLVQAAATASVDVATAPAASPVSQPGGDNIADRAQLMQTALLLSTGLAADSEAIIEARAALRGRISQAADYGPKWLQEGIDMFHRTLQQEGAPPVQAVVPADQPSAKAQCVREASGEDTTMRPFDPLDT